MNKLWQIKFVLIVASALAGSTASAHIGAQDSNGGHVDRGTGEYHCHSDDCVLPGAQQIPEKIIIDEVWTNAYFDMLSKYVNRCNPEKGNLSEANLFVCDKLKVMVNLETEKKIALSQHMITVFQQQSIASNIVLALVVIVVVSGIVLAAYQLWIAAVKGAPQANTDLEASASKVRITSSSVGLIVLALSLLFLYLYVKEIFNIVVIPSS